MSKTGSEPRRPIPHGLVLLIIAVFCIFPRMHGPRWGDGLEFVAVSTHLGVAHPPGYPLFTLLGWIALKFPIEESYHAVLMVCRLAAFVLGSVLYFMLRSLFVHFRQQEWLSRLLALNLALAFCFSDVIRQALHIIEIYILHGVLLAGMAFLALRSALANRPAFNWELTVFGGLFGLSIANHLTAMAMLPLLVYLLGRGFRQGALLGAIGGAILAILIPTLLYGTMPLRHPGEGGQGIFWDDPATFEAILENLRGGEYGQYRFLAAAPGVPFTVGQYAQFFVYRVGMTLESSGRLFLGPTLFALPVGFLVIAATLFGAFKVGIRGDIRWTILLLLLAMALQLGFLFTYNIPDVEDYFLGIQVLAIPFFGVGLLLALRNLFGMLEWPVEKQDQILRLFSLVFLIAVYLSNFDAARVDNAKVFNDWTNRVFTALPEDAVLITAGDGDIYAAWYEQFGRGNRTDVMVYGANFMRFPWFRLTINPEDAHRDLVGFTPGPPGTFHQHIENLSTLVISPLLDAQRPLFTTIQNPTELDALAERYRVRPIRNLLTENEMEALAATHEVYSIFPMLYEILPMNPGPTP